MTRKQPKRPAAAGGKDMSDLDGIRKRDTASGATWFTGPESFTAMAARDRRELLAENVRLRAELAAANKDATRYAVVRRLNPHEFKDLYERNIRGEGAFDELVDAAIAGETT